MSISVENYARLLLAKQEIVKQVKTMLEQHLHDDVESIVDLHLCEILHEVNKLKIS